MIIRATDIEAIETATHTELKFAAIARSSPRLAV